MKIAVILALLAPLAACHSTGGGGIDYQATADTIALYRQDVQDVIFLASPETQARVQALAHDLQRVEEALRMADTGSASSAASSALALADALVAELAPESEVRFYVALAKIALRHVQAAQFSEVVPPTAPDADTPAQ